jgi:hypothetical protein
LCNEPGCQRECGFAHSEPELRPLEVANNYKLQFCGRCLEGKRCGRDLEHVHADEERRLICGYCRVWGIAQHGKLVLKFKRWNDLYAMTPEWRAAPCERCILGVPKPDAYILIAPSFERTRPFNLSRLPPVLMPQTPDEQWQMLSL